MQTFSINAAAEILERDRRTITKALRNVEPDAHERGQRRWRLPKIIKALETSAPMTKQRYNSGVDNVHSDLAADLENDRRTLFLFDDFNRAFERMEAEPSFTKRRQMAISFAPTMIKTCVERYRAHCHAADCFIDADIRARDCMWGHLLELFEKPCAWTCDEVRKHFRVYEEV